MDERFPVDVGSMRKIFPRREVRSAMTLAQHLVRTTTSSRIIGSSQTAARRPSAFFSAIEPAIAKRHVRASRCGTIRRRV